jgi:dTMP kinase
VTILLDIPPEKGLERIGEGRRSTDAMEGRPLEFHRRVRAIFNELPGFYPTPIVIVDASSDADTVYGRILEGLDRAAF